MHALPVSPVGRLLCSGPWIASAHCSAWPAIVARPWIGVDGAHRCHADEPPTPLDRDLQAQLCLTPAHERCERYLQYLTRTGTMTPGRSTLADGLISTRMLLAPQPPWRGLAGTRATASARTAGRDRRRRGPARCRGRGARQRAAGARARRSRDERESHPNRWTHVAPDTFPRPNAVANRDPVTHAGSDPDCDTGADANARPTHAGTDARPGSDLCRGRRRQSRPRSPTDSGRRSRRSWRPTGSRIRTSSPSGRS